MIKSSAYGVRHLVLVATLALLCGLTSTAVRADDDMSLGLAIPGLSVFLGNGLGYYAPPPPVYYAPPPRPIYYAPPPPPGYYVAPMRARIYERRRWEHRGPPPWAGRWRHDDDDWHH